ncbi:MAG: hypothetical protein FWD13_01555 [Treponema sp.]|nr:hypothetical protein [Treponema sp.]
MVKKEEKPKLRLTSPTGWILVICLVISLVSLIIYLTESGYSDDILFLLLAILRYSSFMVFVCAFYKLLLNFYRIFRHKRKVNPIKIIIYFLLLFYGIFFVLLEALIVVIAKGNT